MRADQPELLGEVGQGDAVVAVLPEQVPRPPQRLRLVEFPGALGGLELYLQRFLGRPHIQAAHGHADGVSEVTSSRFGRHELDGAVPQRILSNGVIRRHTFDILANSF